VLDATSSRPMELLADRDPEEARKLLDPVLEHMMEAVHRYEGPVNQVNATSSSRRYMSARDFIGAPERRTESAAHRAKLTTIRSRHRLIASPVRWLNQ